MEYSQNNHLGADYHNAITTKRTSYEIQMREDVMKMVRAAIRAVDPYVAVRNRLQIIQSKVDEDQNNTSSTSFHLVAHSDQDGNRQLDYDLSKYDKIKIIAFGKASANMALATAEVISETNVSFDGIVIIKDNHASDDEIDKLEKYNIVVRSASHPVPDARSVSGANEILDSVSSSDIRTLIIVCISGGGSALFCSPQESLTLDDVISTNVSLLASGMPIEKINVVRKLLDKGKGGKLANAAYPATLLTLILSDIIGDPLDLIASGPTVPALGNSYSAYHLVKDYSLGQGGQYELPSTVIKLLLESQKEKVDEVQNEFHPAFSVMDSSGKLYSENILVGNNNMALMAAAKEAEKLGYNPVVLGTQIDGEASCVARVYVAMAEMISRQRGNDDSIAKYRICPLPAALITGGETTVTLPRNCTGKGGRNQELALSAAIRIHEIGLRDVVLASVGTDGTDGPTDAAGAIVDGGTISFDDASSHTSREALNSHDAYSFFDSMADDSLIRSGPTGTNVADICIILVR